MEIKSPINAIQKIIRLRVDEDVQEVSRNYPKGEKKSKKGHVPLDLFLSKLNRAYLKAKHAAEEKLEEEKENLQVFITSEKSRLRKRQTEEYQERVKKEVKEPIKLQKGKVESLKEKLKEGKTTAEKFESAKRELQRRKANKREKENRIKQEMEEKFEKKIQKVEKRVKECDYNIKLLSACIMGS